MQPFSKAKPQFKNIPVGVNLLQNMISTIAELTGLKTCYTNHSLRTTCVSHMFNAGVPEKIVGEIIGRQSLTALRQYERTMHRSSV